MRGGIEWFDGIDAVPPTCDPLFAEAGFYDSRAWYGLVERTALPDGARARYLLCENTVLFALREFQGALSGLTSPYTCLHRPLSLPGADAAALRRAGRIFARAVRRQGTLRIDALDGDAPTLRALLAGARAGRMFAERFDHFGNWHQGVAGLSWAAYADARPGVLRETIRRKLRKAERDPAVTFENVTGGAVLEPAIAAYADVYARSWKDAEPFPDFSAGLIRMAAGQGALRLGVLRVDARPVAAQLWIVTDGIASVLKLAHDEAYKPLSPGTVLTALMIRELLDGEHVRALDFGRGDDEYKRGWVDQRRQRIGVVLADPLHPTGAVAILRSLARPAITRLRAVMKTPDQSDAVSPGHATARTPLADHRQES